MLPNSIIIQETRKLMQLAPLILIASLMCWLFGAAIYAPAQVEGAAHSTSYWCTALILVVGCITMCYKRVQLHLSKVDVAIILLGVVATLQAIIYKEFNAHYDAFFATFVLYFAVRCVCQLYPQLKVFIVILFSAITIYECWIGINQVFGLKASNHGLFQITGTLYNPGPYGGLIAVGGILAFVCLYLHYAEIKKLIDAKWEWNIVGFHNLTKVVIYACLTFTVIFAIVILPATFSRAAWVAVVVALLVLALMHAPIYRKCKTVFKLRTIRNVALLSTLVIGVICAGYGAYAIKQRSADGRLLIWQIDSKIIANNPLGVGLGKFAGAYGVEQAKYFRQKERSIEKKMVAGCPDSGFNEYLQMGSETGVVGLGLFLFAIIGAIVKAIRRQDVCGYGLLVLAVFALFSYPFRVLPLRLMFVALLAASASQLPSSNQHFNKKHFGRYITFIIAGIILLTWIYYRTNKRIDIQNKWQETCVWIPSERYDYLVEDGALFYETLKDDYKFLYDYGYALYKQKEYKESIKVLKRGTTYSSDPMFYNIIGKCYQEIGDWEQAEKYILQAYDIIPSRIYPLYLLTKMYIEAHESKKAVTAAQKALSIKIKVESEQTDELKAELQFIIDSLALTTNISH